MANFETFHWVISSSTNLFFLKSALMIFVGLCNGIKGIKKDFQKVLTGPVIYSDELKY